MTPTTPQDRELTLPPSAINTLAFVQSFGPTNASNATIGQSPRVGAAQRTVKDVIGTLEDAGLVAVERRRRNWHTGDATGRTLTITPAGRAHLARLASEAGF
jgi:DNA-binding MarR family transcriptional regulator